MGAGGPGVLGADSGPVGAREAASAVLMWQEWVWVLAVAILWAPLGVVLAELASLAWETRIHRRRRF